ncbi:Leucine-zipper-like transcriptional regulator 1 [Nowakowskiella sp. JEL0078]|nr:Leucine-zipper-like transcriptional regulator 1 [Nowakowskiella sp. JEL0078]
MSERERNPSNTTTVNFVRNPIGFNLTTNSDIHPGNNSLQVSNDDFLETRGEAIPRKVSHKLSESKRSLEISLQNFSSIDTVNTFSYGATPFLVHNRRWGVNLYPYGLRKNSNDINQRIDVFVHIWAKDDKETEEQYLQWIQSNKIRFTITITEPTPSLLFIQKTSEDAWCDMEDAAGWWLISLKACPRLLDLTNDTLIIKIDFEYNSFPISKKNTESNENLGGFDVLLNNKALSDFGISNGYEEVFVQKCVLSTKLPNFDSVLSRFSSNIDLSSSVSSLSSATTQSSNYRIKEVFLNSTNSFRQFKLGLTSQTLMISGIPIDILQTTLRYIYTFQIPVLENSESYAFMFLFSELFGVNELQRASKRGLLEHITATEALPMLKKFGQRSAALQELISVFVIQNFHAIKFHNPSFSDLLTPTPATPQILCILRRLDAKPPIHTIQTVHSHAPAMNLDWRHSLAFRSLLSNPDISDVQFKVDGKIIYAQKSVLSAVSDYFLTMFNSGLQESMTPTIIDIPDFPYSAFHNLLLFLYTHELDTPSSLADMGYLYVIADKYEVPELGTRAKELLQENLTPDNVAGFLFNFACRFVLLRELVMSFLVENWNEVRKTDDFARWVGGKPGDEYASVVAELLLKLKVRDFDLVNTVEYENGMEADEWVDGEWTESPFDNKLIE